MPPLSPPIDPHSGCHPPQAGTDADLVTSLDLAFGKIELALDVPDRSWEVAVTLPGRYAVSGAVRGAVTAIPGVVAVQDT